MVPLSAEKAIFLLGVKLVMFFHADIGKFALIYVLPAIHN